MVLVAGWLVAAWLLTRTTIPANLHEPHVRAAAEFPTRVLDRSARYDGVLRWLWVAGTLLTLAALVVFTKLGPRIAAAITSPLHDLPSSPPARASSTCPLGASTRAVAMCCRSL